jgi:hypothetical protein
MAKATAGWRLGLCCATIMSACEPVHWDEPADAAPLPVTDAMRNMPLPDAGTPDAAAVIRRWYKLADGIEHPGEVPGLRSDEPSAPENLSLRPGGVVLVEWCDKPGKEATVCKWDGPEASTRDQAWAECDADAEVVCGTIKYPQVLFY